MSWTTRHRTIRAGLVAALGILALLASTVSVAVADPSDTISIIKDGEEGLSTGEIASRLTDATFVTADRVLIGRDDEFADAMTSGVLQSDSPLLLVPSDGPVSDRILAQIDLLAPDEVLLLGGTEAISSQVETQLAQAGYTVGRTFGPSRIETATEIADVGAAQADTVLIARAFSDPAAGDPTQAFADAMAAGGWSASTGWPILLTQSEVLTGSTRDYLADGAVRNAFILGGTAAVSAEVETQLRDLVDNVERVAGSNRFGTAVAVAEKVDAPTSADVSRITLVDGQGENAWAGGFAAAAHSSAFDAPIVLTSGEVIPPATAAWLSGAAPDGRRLPAGGGQDTPTDTDPIRLTCVTVSSVCDQARALLDLPPRVLLRFDPPPGVAITQGDPVTVFAGGDVEELRIDGTCIDGPVAADSPAEVVVTTVGACDLVVTPVLPGGVTQDASTATYVVDPVLAAILFMVEDQETVPVGADDFVGDLWLAYDDGDVAQLLAECAIGCDDLRVAPDGQTAVVVESAGSMAGDALVLRQWPSFDEALPLVPAEPGRDFDQPQFTPDGQRIIAHQITGKGSTVVSIDLDDPVVTELAPGVRLAGTDAVGFADFVPSGVGVLTTELRLEDTTLQSTLGIVDAQGGPVVELDTSIPGLLRSASLSPDGSAYAHDAGADPVVVVGFFGDRLSMTSSADEPIQVDQLVWLGTDRVQALASRPPAARVQPDEEVRQVDLVVGASELVLEEGPASPDLEFVGRPGQYEGSLVAESADALVLADTGSVIRQFSDVIIRNPHVLPCGICEFRAGERGRKPVE